MHSVELSLNIQNHCTLMPCTHSFLVTLTRRFCPEVWGSEFVITQ